MYSVSAKRQVSKSGLEVQTKTLQRLFRHKNNLNLTSFEQILCFELISFKQWSVSTAWSFFQICVPIICRFVCISKISKKILPRIEKTLIFVHLQNTEYISQWVGLFLKIEFQDQGPNYPMRILTWESWKQIFRVGLVAFEKQDMFRITFLSNVNQP